jgi:RHS repeat-associated protein
MHVLRHEHVPNQPKLKFASDFSQDSQEQISCACRFQIPPPVVAAKSNEMQIALAVLAFQTFRHSANQKSGNGQRVGRQLTTNEVGFYMTDHLGNVRYLGGSATGYDIDYYPYGGIIVNSDIGDDRYQFTGKERDSESGNDYFGARHYSSSFGRFMQPDPSPMGIAMADPQSWNLYSYVRNRPTRSVDVGGNWATDIHAQIVTYALQGYASAGELAELVHRQYVMDADQSSEHQYMHAMSNGNANQSAADASNLMWNFVAQNLQDAKANVIGGEFTTLALVRLGDAIHTVEDYTSPMHTSGGEPLPWGGVGRHPIDAFHHWEGENSPSRDWSAIGTAIRLTMAAFMQVNPEQAAKHGLTESTFNKEANARIEQYVNSFFALPNTGISTEGQRDAARQCALGNPAACDH